MKKIFVPKEQARTFHSAACEAFEFLGGDREKIRLHYIPSGKGNAQIRADLPKDISEDAFLSVVEHFKKKPYPCCCG